MATETVKIHDMYNSCKTGVIRESFNPELSYDADIKYVIQKFLQNIVKVLILFISSITSLKSIFQGFEVNEPS